MLILLVGLQAIPDEVYEAAAIDGASRWQTFRRITLPLLRPSLALALILSVTGSLLAFDQFFILTKGGPDNRTVTVVQLIYREAFVRQNLGSPPRCRSSCWWRCWRSTWSSSGPAAARQRRRLSRWERVPLDQDALLRAYRRVGHHLPVPAALERLASVSPQPGTAQTDGYGLGNYRTLFDFQAGLPPSSSTASSSPV